MNMETAVLVVTILGTYIVLVYCLRESMKHVAELTHDLRETTREYKLYQAVVNKDYQTVGVLRNITAKDEPQDEEEPESPAVTITQHG